MARRPPGSPLVTARLLHAALMVSSVTLAMCVLGLVAGFVTQATWTYPAFGAVALANMLVYLPTQAQFDDWVARSEPEPR